MKTLMMKLVVLSAVWSGLGYAIDGIPVEFGSNSNYASNMVASKEPMQELQNEIAQIEQQINSETKRVEDIKRTIRRARMKIEQYKASVAAQMRIAASCKNQRATYEMQGSYMEPLAQQKLQACYSRVWLSQEKIREMSTVANRLYAQIRNLERESNILIPDIEALRIQLEGFRQMLRFYKEGGGQ